MFKYLYGFYTTVINWLSVQAHNLLLGKAAEPKAAEPKAAEPKAAEPKAAEPKAAEPKAAEPKAAESKAAEPKAAKVLYKEMSLEDQRIFDAYTEGEKLLNTYLDRKDQFLKVWKQGVSNIFSGLNDNRNKERPEFLKNLINCFTYCAIVLHDRLDSYNKNGFLTKWGKNKPTAADKSRARDTIQNIVSDLEESYKILRMESFEKLLKTPLTTLIEKELTNKFKSFCCPVTNKLIFIPIYMSYGEYDSVVNREFDTHYYRKDTHAVDLMAFVQSTLELLELREWNFPKTNQSFFITEEILPVYYMFFGSEKRLNFNSILIKEIKDTLTTGNTGAKAKPILPMNSALNNNSKHESATEKISAHLRDHILS